MERGGDFTPARPPPGSASRPATGAAFSRSQHLVNPTPRAADPGTPSAAATPRVRRFELADADAGPERASKRQRQDECVRGAVIMRGTQAVYDAIKDPCVSLMTGADGAASQFACFDGSRFELGTSRAFPPSSTHQDIFDGSVVEVVDKVLNYSTNAALCAYGQTGSGKTYVMRGPSGREGIIHMALRRIFGQTPAPQDRTVKVSAFEIAQEQIKDLLFPESKRKVMPMDTGDGSLVLQGLQSLPVSTAAEAIAALERGWAGRAVAATNANDASSRSHAFFRVELGDLLLGARCFDLVDLGGSENATVLDGMEERQRRERAAEAKNINESLSTFRRVVLNLKQGKPAQELGGVFRSSVLTRILKGALTSNSATCVLACVRPEFDAATESKATLNFLKDVTSLKVAKGPLPGASAATPADVLHLREALQELRESERGARAALEDAEARGSARAAAELQGRIDEAAARAAGLQAALGAAEARAAEGQQRAAVAEARLQAAEGRSQQLRREAEQAREEAERAAQSADELAGKLTASAAVLEAARREAARAAEDLAAARAALAAAQQEAAAACAAAAAAREEAAAARAAAAAAQETAGAALAETAATLRRAREDVAERERAAEAAVQRAEARAAAAEAEAAAAAEDKAETARRWQAELAAMEQTARAARETTAAAAADFERSLAAAREEAALALRERAAAEACAAEEARAAADALEKLKAQHAEELRSASAAAAAEHERALAAALEETAKALRERAATEARAAEDARAAAEAAERLKEQHAEELRRRAAEARRALDAALVRAEERVAEARGLREELEGARAAAAGREAAWAAERARLEERAERSSRTLALRELAIERTNAELGAAREAAGRQERELAEAAETTESERAAAAEELRLRGVELATVRRELAEVLARFDVADGRRRAAVEHAELLQRELEASRARAERAAAESTEASLAHRREMEILRSERNALADTLELTRRQLENSNQQRELQAAAAPVLFVPGTPSRPAAPTPGRRAASGFSTASPAFFRARGHAHPSPAPAFEFRAAAAAPTPSKAQSPGPSSPIPIVEIDEDESRTPAPAPAPVMAPPPAPAAEPAARRTRAHAGKQAEQAGPVGDEKRSRRRRREEEAEERPTKRAAGRRKAASDEEEDEDEAAARRAREANGKLYLELSRGPDGKTAEAVRLPVAIDRHLLLGKPRAAAAAAPRSRAAGKPLDIRNIVEMTVEPERRAKPTAETDAFVAAFEGAYEEADRMGVDWPLLKTGAPWEVYLLVAPGGAQLRTEAELREHVKRSLEGGSDAGLSAERPLPLTFSFRPEHLSYESYMKGKYISMGEDPKKPNSKPAAGGGKEAAAAARPRGSPLSEVQLPQS